MHYGGRTELEMHNLFGHLMSRAANLAVREMYPGKRPFLISRSTFAGSGTWTGHWVGYIFLMTGQTQVEFVALPSAGRQLEQVVVFVP
jgi:Glycosyl hydrolases family 31